VRAGPDPKATRWIALRIGLVGLGFLAGFGGLAWRAVQLQVVQRDKLSSEARDQYLRQFVMKPRRGAVTDRSGVLLAGSADAESVFVDPEVLADRTPSVEGAVKQLAGALGLEPRALGKKVDRGAHFVWAKRRISPAEAGAVRRLGLPGVSLVAETRRYYPKVTLAGQLLGVTGDEGSGLDGVELALDDLLRGESTKVASQRDGAARVALLDAPGSARGREGARVELTIDQGLQLATERALSAAVRGSRALSGVAVALDPATGEVLAMASFPAVNPNAVQSGQELRNRAVTDAFEPGSTIKTFTIAGALERGVLKAGDAIDCGAGYTVGGHVLHDHKPLGWAGPAKVLAASSNVGAARIGARLGKQGLSEVLSAFGFGEKAGIDLPGERRGQLPFPKADITLATQSFGQGMTATPLQVVAAMGAIANGGTLMRPMLVKRVLDPADGTVLDQSTPTPVRRVVSAGTAATLARWLTGAVEDPDGTGKRARPEGWRVAGKTGTAQKADPVSGGYSLDRNFSSFVGFAPAESPRVVIGVFIDEPKGETYGGEVAAPPFREIAEYALKMLGVPPDGLPAVVTAPPPAPAPVLAARAAPSARTGPSPVAPAAPVAPATPDEAEEESAGPPPVEVAARRRAGATGGVAVPALAGLPARAAIRTLEALDLGAELDGSGRVVSQTPPPGRVVDRGARVKITLAPPG
jgi:cell division protein FtsI (penicillin-binding protein 3)